jgi:hypothetical protein
MDDDRGLPAASAVHREGFQRVVAQGTVEQVGRLLSSDVTRLSRHCSAW